MVGNFIRALPLAALLTVSGIAVAQSSDTVWKEPPRQDCFDVSAAIPVSFDDGTKTGEWIFPVYDADGTPITSISVEKARQSTMKHCESDDETAVASGLLLLAGKQSEPIWRDQL